MCKFALVGSGAFWRHVHTVRLQLARDSHASPVTLGNLTHANYVGGVPGAGDARLDALTSKRLLAKPRPVRDRSWRLCRPRKSCSMWSSSAPEFVESSCR